MGNFVEGGCPACRTEWFVRKMSHVAYIYNNSATVIRPPARPYPWDGLNLELQAGDYTAPNLGPLAIKISRVESGQYYYPTVDSTAVDNAVAVDLRE